ncbi:MAG: RsmE family RNA methyltransferase [Erysipelotrichaceae bacterium]|nr:RsmE family RNA methyltransferase [Erysipelotrichaceae bacterium]
MQRYFVDKVDGQIVFTKDDLHHLINVMRVRPHEQIELVVDNIPYIYEINSIRPFRITEIQKNDFNPELASSITLFYCLVKGDKLDLVLQKATELGVSEIVLVQSKRSIVKIAQEDIKKKLERFQSIVKAAAMQSKRLTIPTLNKIIDISSIDKSILKNHNFIAFEGEAGGTSSFKKEIEEMKLKDSVSVLVGPEGGFTLEEVKKMNSIGFKNVSLGRRILRSETAAITILSVLSFLIEAKQ